MPIEICRFKNLTQKNQRWARRTLWSRQNSVNMYDYGLKTLFLTLDGKPIAKINYTHYKGRYEEEMHFVNRIIAAPQPKFVKATGRTPAEELLIRFILQERPKKVVTEMEAPLARVFRLRFQKKYGLRLSSIKESDFKKLKPLNNI